MIDLDDFIQWLFAASARRQDALGNRPCRGRRRIKQGKKIVIYSRQAFEGSVRNDWCGIAWQDDKRGRDNDQLWRLALAVSALELDGLHRWKACYQILLIISNHVAPVLRRRKCTRFSNDEYQEAERLRILVTRYITRCERAKIDLRRDLQWMLSVYKSIHGVEMGKEYYEQAREDFYGQIEEARKHCGINDWLRVMPQVAWATTAHEWGNHGEAARWYRQAYDEIVAMEIPSEWKNTYLPWLQAHIQACETQQAPEEELRPVLFEGALMTLKEAVRRTEGA